MTLRTAAMAGLLALAPLTAQDHPVPDRRNIRAGLEIPTETYADQPYIVKTNDGAWLVCLTTGAGLEGQAGQHVVTIRSEDQGRTWSPPVDVEPAGPPEASYAVMLKAPAGRVYIFYNHNTDNVRRVKADDPPYAGGWCNRVDSLGHFVLKYSDDHGRSWSAERYDIPVREFEIDGRNPYGGALRFFWNVGKAFAHAGAGFVPLHKVGGFGEGFFTSSEGVLLRSENILSESDPRKIRWETLPDGEAGLRTPPGGGPVAEEQSFSVLGDGSFFSVYRSIDGQPVVSYSRDGGRRWDEPRYMRYADGRLVKHPRAANFAWRCANGKYLYWFHNHGGRFIREHPSRRTMAYNDRNPVWLAGGVEVDSAEGKVIRWSQPEIVLYDDDPYIRMSYPDLVEDGGRYFLTETQKETARVHEIEPALVEGLWGQFENRSVAAAGLLLDLRAPVPGETPMPRLPAFLARDSRRPDHGAQDFRSGFSIDLWVTFEGLEKGQILLDNRTSSGQGVCLQAAGDRQLELILNDARTESRWMSDPGMLEAGRRHHVAVVVDGGPKIISFIIDGKLCDGGEYRQFGWGRFNPNLNTPQGGPTLRIGPNLIGKMERLRWYDRRLRTSEAIGNYQAGL
ncbi:MAG: hypothetical protein KIT09_10190 [Bryobacteraceae bacterium]|nr:hypothetical protein [Bryobacteraceae bacterium]